MSAVTKLFANTCRKFRQLGVSFTVTRRRPSYTARDGTTGWRGCNYVTGSITMPIISRGMTSTLLPPGIYCHYDAVGLTTDDIKIDDQVLDANSQYFKINAIQKRFVGNKLAFREVQLQHYTMGVYAPGTATWSKTRPQTPQRRIKTYIDTYARAAQITKDDDSTAAAFATIWEGQPYPLEDEFLAATSEVFGLYVVGQPNSTPRLDFDQTPSHYEEHVPVHICTINKAACTGAILQWKMEAELRYVCEQNPTGSQISMEARTPEDRMVGGVWMYDTPLILSYVRDPTT